MGEGLGKPDRGVVLHGMSDCHFLGIQACQSQAFCYKVSAHVTLGVLRHPFSLNWSVLLKLAVQSQQHERQCQLDVHDPSKSR